MADLVAGRVEQGAGLGRVIVEFGKILAILALHDERLAVLARTFGKAAETVIDVRQPIAALGVFAFVDDIEPNVALFSDDLANRFT